MTTETIEQLLIRYQRTHDLTPYARNSRTHSDAQIAQIAASIQEFGFTNPILVDERGEIIAGHGRLLAAESLGLDEVPTIVLAHLTETQRRALVIADNKLALNAGWDDKVLRLELQDLVALDVSRDLLGFSADEFAALMNGPSGSGSGSKTPGAGSLSDKFLVPPFSVLNAREGWWQERKRAWIALGIKSELGRGSGGQPGGNDRPAADYTEQRGGSKARGTGSGKAKQQQHVAGVLMTSDSGNDPRYYAKKQAVEAQLGRTLTTEEFQRHHYQGPDSYESGTSIFDPVLTELAYRWFCPAGGLILDPFAGGSVRGIVASKTGRAYVGHELRQEQVDANRIQGGELCVDDPLPPAWICGDSRNIPTTCADVDADMIFSCPPYADLEVYSDDPQDLSTLGYAEFRDAYREIIAAACARLRPDRFACFVVGDVRDKRGNYVDFVGDTVQAFRDAGLEFYNEAILITALGSLPIRVGKQFSASRKLGKTHQNVLLFVKGDGKRAAKACGEIEISDDAFASVLGAEGGDASGA